MTYDTRSIMQAAHAMVRQWRKFQPRRTYAQLFADGLRCAWQQAREAAATAARVAAPVVRTADAIRAQIVALENVDRLGHAGMDRLDALRAELREAA